MANNWQLFTNSTSTPFVNTTTNGWNPVPGGGTTSGSYIVQPLTVSSGTTTWWPEQVLGGTLIWNVGVASGEIVRVAQAHGAEGDIMVMNRRTLHRALAECNASPVPDDEVNLVVDDKTYKVRVIDELPDKMIFVVSRAKAMFRRKPNLSGTLTTAQPMTATAAKRWAKLYEELMTDNTTNYFLQNGPGITPDRLAAGADGDRDALPQEVPAQGPGQ
jgi:hypothetical protein